MIHKEVKSLADSIICNAETHGFVPIKRSFVEEVSSILTPAIFDFLLFLTVVEYYSKFQITRDL